MERELPDLLRIWCLFDTMGTNGTEVVAKINQIDKRNKFVLDSWLAEWNNYVVWKIHNQSILENIPAKISYYN